MMPFMGCLEFPLWVYKFILNSSHNQTCSFCGKTLAAFLNTILLNSEYFVLAVDSYNCPKTNLVIFVKQLSL